MNTLLVTFGGSKVQGSIAIGVLHITVAGRGSYKGLDSLGMTIGSSVVQSCGSILSLQGTSTSLKMCLQQDKLASRNKPERCPTLTYRDTAQLCANAVKNSGSQRSSCDHGLTTDMLTRVTLL